MASIPLDVILSWPTPNYENPETHDKGALVGTIILAVVGCSTVGLRLWARFMIARKLAIEDYFILLALIFSLGLSVAANLLIYNYGGDRHAWDMRPDLLPDYFLMLWIMSQLYLISQGLIKLSLLLLYLNLLRRTSNKVNIYVTWVLIVFISLYTIIGYFVNVFQCSPVTAAWNDPKRYIDADAAPCLDQGFALFVPSVIATVSDFLVAGSPVLFLRQLQLPKRQKWILVLVFSLGFVICAAAIMRVVSLHRWLYGEMDKTWYGYYHQIWTMIELWLGIICACVPVLQKQFRAQGVFGSKISAGWSKIKSRKSSSSSASSGGEAAADFEPGQQEWRGTESAVSKSLPKSLFSTETGVSQLRSANFSEKTFLDSSSV